MKIDDKDKIMVILEELAREKIIKRDTVSFFDYMLNNIKPYVVDFVSKNKLIIEPYGYECKKEKARIIAEEMKKYGLDAREKHGRVIIYYNGNYNKKKLDDYKIKVRYDIRKILGI